MKYNKVEVTSAQEVDTVTIQRIEEIAGDINDQVKNLRYGLKALLILMGWAKGDANTMTWAVNKKVELIHLSEDIDAIVAEGKVVKQGLSTQGTENEEVH